MSVMAGSRYARESASMRRSRFRFGLVLSAALSLGAWMAHGCTDDGAAGLCSPGDEIFCRCRGGDPGTKPCAEDGNSFGECLPCEGRETTGEGGESTSSNQGGFGPGPGGGTPGDKPLFAQCMDDQECESSTCRNNYCTKNCEQPSDCLPKAECVETESDGTICLAVCETAADCEPYEAPPSMCGFATAVDTWWVTVCANWGGAHQVMPVDTDCAPAFDHEACNLGYPHKEIVCAATGVCTKGCFTNDDCAEGISCSTQGALGNCQ
jgi:hypothetical protein